MKMKEYIETGKKYVIEIDLKNYFDTIPLDRMISKIEEYISDEIILCLIRQYLFCNISYAGKLEKKMVGIVQGNSISPILSNLYLHEFDQMLEEKGVCWVRFADNIYIFTELYEEALPIYREVSQYLIEKLGLTVNREKSGIYDVGKRTILGYDILQNGNKVDIRKHVYREKNQYSNWHDCRMEFINGRFHVLSDGIISRKDYSLLFENEEKKHYIPVEVTDQINLYGNVVIASNVLQTFNHRGINVSFFDKYGNFMGSFLPEKSKKSTEIILEQSKKYLDEKVRTDIARRMEIASLHNIRTNLRYYEKKHKGQLKEAIDALSQYITKINSCTTVAEMMLVEAKARQLYYSCINIILDNEEFKFIQRTKRPPKDELNACISFGNTLLYNYFSHIIWKKGMNPCFGVVHASNRRSQSLNLDFADIFKPIIIDRIIFTMINKKMLIISKDFEKSNEGGTYLSKEGKKIFLQMYENKMNSKVVVKGRTFSYRQIMENEVQNYKNYLLKEEKYKPYKYY